MIGVVAALQILALADAMRWLRVAQREHYLAGSVTRFARRWWRVGVGLPVRGRTSKLAWTRRMKVLALISGLLHVGVVLAVGAFLPLVVGSVVALVLVPLTIDAALFLAAPIEERLIAKFVRAAAAKLATISPTIVAITGSYGKTSTKVVLAHIVNGTKTVSASPASFNNRAGLARAVNEGLTAGTDVFVAEMGTYGPGEIAALCRWCPPTVSVITAIGPVHLERFGSLDVTLAAKSEILAPASTVVLNVDDERLGPLADRITSEGSKRVMRASATRVDADIAVIADDEGARVYENGDLVGRVIKLPTAPSNVACAIAAARALGVPANDIVTRLASAPTASNRLESVAASSGAVVLDDTFNSNPAGARLALEALRTAGALNGRKVVITPGMIELGTRQADENEAFGAAAGATATIVGVVGRTNAKALTKGVAQTDAELKRFGHRDKAVAWVRANLGPGDAVLYENDLPDHYK
ncbi:MAG TPA: Mur ligase family protein [Acidimicrobiales bacterium]|nr:Mur ligase family protein [Acidimicrobiales bacterium]